MFLLQGAATDKLRKYIIDFGGASKLAGVFDNINEATKDAMQFASSGEIVLLSPGCASFGMFKNEFERGNEFKKAISGLVN